LSTENAQQQPENSNEKTAEEQTAAAADNNGQANGAAADPQPPQSNDVDDVELREALTAVKAEDGGEGGEQKDGKDTGAQGADKTGAQAGDQGQQQPAQDGQQAGQQQQQQPPMIPKARLDEESAKRKDAEKAAAYWQGRAEQAATAAPAAKQGDQQQQPPAVTVESINREIDALSDKFDNGEITMKEFKAKERELNAKADALRAPAQQQQQQPVQSDGNELYLETLTEKLEEDHKWVKPFNAVATETEWNFVASKARENLAARGVEIKGKGAIGSYNLRKEISRVIDQIGPNLIADRAAKAAQMGFAFPNAAPAAKQDQQQQQQQPKPGMSPAAQARKDGLAKAAAAPPDLSKLNGGASDPTAPTEERLEVMSDEDIGKLPDPVRKRMMGIIP
jgi:hypothetical protein